MIYTGIYIAFLRYLLDFHFFFLQKITNLSQSEISNECNLVLPISVFSIFSLLNTFRKKVKNVVTSKGIQVEIECK
jgi:hypothetical protein